ncbi:MAG: hypothetical protein M1825_003483 [Sarcosagium campestre]|nr:MAG: hypothetical protein M1825_003483 [Sarcosagium campestre]
MAEPMSMNPPDMTFERLKFVVENPNHPLYPYYSLLGIEDILCKCHCNEPYDPAATYALADGLSHVCPQFNAAFEVYGFIGRGNSGYVFSGRLRPQPDRPQEHHCAIKMQVHHHRRDPHEWTDLIRLDFDHPNIHDRRAIVHRENLKMWLLRGSPYVNSIVAGYSHHAYTMTVMQIFGVDMQDILENPPTAANQRATPSCAGSWMLSNFFREQFEEVHVCKVYSHLLNGLAFCNERGVIHRDISPRNYLIEEDYSAQWIDFDTAILDNSKIGAPGPGLDNIYLIDWGCELEIDPVLASRLIAYQGLGRPEEARQVMHTVLTQNPTVYSNWRFGVMMYQTLHGKGAWEDPFLNRSMLFKDDDDERFLERHERRLRVMRNPLAVSERLSQDAADALQAQLARSEEDRPSITELTTFPWFQGWYQRAFTSLTLEPTYWRRLTRSTYRLPDQPLLHADGARWKSLYQRLLTESRVYTWGQTRNGACGISFEQPDSSGRSRMPSGVAWPTEMDVTRDLDPVVDLQCGGWSTTVLTSKGDLYTAGLINGLLHPVSTEDRSLRRLAYPAVFAEEDPATTLSQFSAGRSHVLGLADTGRIWLWTSKNNPARHIQFVGFETADNIDPATSSRYNSRLPRATRVVAGWNRSSAYFPGKGIVVWTPAVIIDDRNRLEAVNARDDKFFVDAEPVPDTGYIRPRGNARESSTTDTDGICSTIGQVVNHVILEGFVVFLTDLGKVFSAVIDPQDSGHPMELGGFEPSAGRAKMSEINGSFRSFAVFNTDGDIVVGDTDLLNRTLEARAATAELSITDEAYPKGTRPPEIQNRGIISLAFGDWHRMALTASGHILAFGKESDWCGCLGLGIGGIPFIRGVSWRRHFGSMELQAPPQGRRVWFSPEQHEWLRFLSNLSSEVQFASPLSAANPNPRTKLGDWIEAVGADWDMHPNLDTPNLPPALDLTPDHHNDHNHHQPQQQQQQQQQQPWGHGQPAYMALKVSAAGWHCGALVLANRARIDRMHEAHKGFLPRNSNNTRENLSLFGWVATAWENRYGGDDPPPSRVEDAVRDHKFGSSHVYYYSARKPAELERSLPPEALHPLSVPQFDETVHTD